MYENIVSVSADVHGRKRLKQVTDYSFADKLTAVPLTIPETMVAAAEYPIGFTKNNDTLEPSALLGLANGRNLFVDANGRWIGNYIPAIVRRYPFVIGHTPGDRNLALCIDESSGLLSETEGEPLFTEDLQPAPTLVKTLQFCKELESARGATLLATTAIVEAGLIQPWPLKIQQGDSVREISGLFRIEKAAFFSLSDENVLKLRANGGLTLAYAHLISMHRLQALAKMTPAVAPPQPAPPTKPTSDLSRVPSEDLVFRF
ncbi:SapC family protein [Rhodocista pekingensis]|uniref:SapC family protein n=1 Tax=Rhodocista pekingensis TaxID=201185 RepID=A0ABW2KZB8_9PROT